MSVGGWTVLWLFIGIVLGCLGGSITTCICIRRRQEAEEKV